MKSLPESRKSKRSSAFDGRPGSRLRISWSEISVLVLAIVLEFRVLVQEERRVCLSCQHGMRHPTLREEKWRKTARIYLQMLRHSWNM